MDFFKKIFKKKVKSQEDYYLASQWTLMGRKLKKHKLARFSMLILGKAHIGEVQASIWDDETMDICAAKGVVLLEVFFGRQF